MASTFNAVEMTKGPTLQFEKGLNSRRIRHVFGATLSGVTTLNVCKLPPGAEIHIAGFKVNGGHAAIGDTADKYWLKDNEGNIYCNTAVAATADTGVISHPLVFGNAALGRITGSAQLQLAMEHKAATGTAALSVDIYLSYRSSKDGDG